MTIIDKIKIIKKETIENIEEYYIIKDMNAKEIAMRYGYTKLIDFIRHKMMIQAQELKEKMENGEEILEDSTILLKIHQENNEKIVFLEEGFGEKETYDYKIINLILKKYNIESSFGNILEDEYLQLKMIPPKTSLKNRLQEMYDNKESYIQAAKETAKETKEKAGNTTKKLLHSLTDWADENL